MDWNTFHEIKDRIRKNLNEFTDDIIRSDGTLDPVSGSNQDTPDYPDELEQYHKAIEEWNDEIMQKGE